MRVMTDSENKGKNKEESGNLGAHLLREHPALIASGFYALATAIGMFYSWRYLQHFGVNVFLYAELSDFLLASFKDAVVWLMVAGLTVAWYFDLRASRSWGSRERRKGLRWYGSPSYRRWSYPGALLTLLLLLNFYAGEEAKEIRAGAIERFNVKFAESEITRKLAILETTARFVIFFNPDTQMVFVRPHEAIGEIFFAAPAEESQGIPLE